MEWDWEPWLYQFKRLYAGDKGPPVLNYLTLCHLLDLWYEGCEPASAVEQVKSLLASASQIRG